MSGQAKVTLTFEDGRRETVAVPSPTFVIGRSAECQVVLADPYVSRKHLAVEFSGGNFRVQDLKSSAGSKIGGESLSPDVWADYHPGEALHLGGSSCVITIEWVEADLPAQPLQDRQTSERANQVIERAMKLAEEAMAASQKRAEQEAEKIKGEARESWQRERQKLEEDWQKERKKKEESIEADLDRKFADRKKKAEKLEAHINDLQKTIVELETAETRLKPLAEELRKNLKENERALKEAESLESRRKKESETIRDLQSQIELAKQELMRCQAVRGQLQNDKARLDQEIQSLKKTLETMMIEGRRQVEAEIANHKERLTKDLETATLRERAKFDEQNRAHVLKFYQRKKQFIETLVLDIVGALKSSGVSEPANGKALEKQVRESSQRTFEAHYNELAEADHTKTTADTDVGERAQQTKKFLKWAAASIALIFALAFAIEPKLIAKVQQFVTSTNESGETAAETYSRQMVEEAHKARFAPTQSDEWRESITDKILYTKNYSEAQKSPELEKQWIQHVHRFFTKDLDVDEEVVTAAIGVERSMVARLLAEREKIHPDFVQLGVEKMQSIEADANSRLAETLKKKMLISRWHEESESFWKSALTREPASPSSGQNTGSSDEEDPAAD